MATPLVLYLLFFAENPASTPPSHHLPINDSLRIEILLDQLPLASPKEQSAILKSLRKFEFTDYSSSDKDQFTQFISNKKNVSSELVLLCGFLKMDQTLNTLAIKYKNDKHLLQQVNIALVRAGDPQKAETLRKNIEKLTVNDDLVYELLPLLVYTKNAKIYDWLLTNILSNEKNCHPADAEGAGNINCAYRIIEAITPNIIDFPLAVDRWGDLKVDSYPKALAMVQDWIKVNQNSYNINIQTY